MANKRNAPSEGRYLVLRGVSCLIDKDLPEAGEVAWDEGEILDLATAPAHIDVAGLLEVGAIEEAD